MKAHTNEKSTARNSKATAKKTATKKAGKTS